MKAINRWAAAQTDRWVCVAHLTEELIKGKDEIKC